MNKLEVGMYVRHKCENGGQTISRCTNKVNIAYNVFYIHTDVKGEVIYKSNILKASHNIIDLIEEGDYVNGYLIEMFYDTYNPKTEEYEDILGIAIYDDARMDCVEEIRPLRTLDIKSIVTKEQFKSMEYSLEG